MEQLYGSLIADKLIDERLAQNLWDAGFQSISSLLELPADARELRELLQLDCPTLQKIGVAYSLVAAIKKLQIGIVWIMRFLKQVSLGRIVLDSVTGAENPVMRTTTSITHSSPSSIASGYIFNKLYQLCSMKHLFIFRRRATR